MAISLRHEDLLAHSAFLRNLTRRLVHDEATADDVAQETWTAALGAPPRGTVRPWLAAIARNAARKRHRTDTRRRLREERVARPEAQTHSAQELEDVLRAVLDLDEPFRETVLLRYYEGLDIEAISKRQCVPAATVRSRLARARGRLRERLDERYGTRRAWVALLAPYAGEAGPLAAVTHPRVLVVLAVTLLVSLGILAAVESSDSKPTPEPPAGARLVAGGALENGPGAGPTAVAEQQGVTSPVEADERVAVNPRSGVARVSGVVVDQVGHPLPNVEVFLGAVEDPWSAEEPFQGPAGLLGRAVRADQRGEFTFELPRAARVCARARYLDPYQDAQPTTTTWIEAPQQDLRMVIRRAPTAQIVVGVHDERSGRDLSGFTVVAMAENAGFYQRPASGTLVTITIPLIRPEDFRVWLHKPEPPQQVETRVLLAPFEKRHVTLTIPRSGSLHRGRVVDRDGRGIEGALVYFGDDCAGRGGEPFLTFREGWVSGVRSGAGGWFELTGQGPWISAFHPEHSSATVTADACDTIALGPRGALEGRLLDAQGEPLPMQRISFDHRYQHGPERLTDDEGRFTYDGLEAGTHGIWAADQQLFTFTVDAGEVARLDFQLPEGNLKLRMFREGRPHEVYELNGRLIGLDRTGTLTRLSHWRPRTSNPEELAVAEMPRMRRVASGPDPTTVDPVPPGRYLLVSAQGLTATFDVSGAEARVDLGLATLTVTGRPGQRVQVVPAGASTFVRVAAADSPVTLDDEGVFAFTVHPGNYEVVASGGHVLTRVEVSAQGASIAVDD